jgi:hypothetical protein
MVSELKASLKIASCDTSVQHKLVAQIEVGNLHGQGLQNEYCFVRAKQALANRGPDCGLFTTGRRRTKP